MGLIDIAGSVAVGAVERFRAARGRGGDGRLREADELVDGEVLPAAGEFDEARPATRIAPMLAAAAVCLGLAAMLVSGKLVEIAERQPLGESRDQWLGLASGLDRAANYLSLNRPYDLILDARGAGSAAGRQVESIDAVAAAVGIDADLRVVGGADGTGTEGANGVGTASGSDDPGSPPLDPAPVPTTGGPSEPEDQGDPAAPAQPAAGGEESGAPDPAAGGEESGGPDPAAGGEVPGAPDSVDGESGVADPQSGEGSGVPDPAGGGEGGEGSGVPGGALDRSGEGPPGPDPSGGAVVSPVPPGGGPEAEPVPAQPAGRAVTPEAPLRTYVAGDSQATFLGQSLATGRARNLFDVTNGDRISTSLARPDYFNWPAEVVAVAEADDPELIVFFLGANDWQDMRSGEGARLRRGTDAWRKEWSWRLFVTLEALKREHRHVVWVGQPPMRIDWRHEGAAFMNEIAKEVIAGRDDATMIDIWEIFGGDGDYRERVVGPDGEEFRARQDDGVHLRREASEWVADLVVDVVARRWDLPLG